MRIIFEHGVQDRGKPIAEFKKGDVVQGYLNGVVFLLAEVHIGERAELIAVRLGDGLATRAAGLSDTYRKVNAHVVVARKEE